MKKQIALPSGALGYLNKINIDLEMTGKHFDALNLISDDHYEDTVLSILKDLMEEDPYLLTQIDLMYVFTLVKCSSLGDKIEVTAQCPNTVVISDSGSTARRACLAKHRFSIRQVEDDVIMFTGKVPAFELEVAGIPYTFELRYPSMFTEIELLNYFEEQGKSRKDILNDKETQLLYAKRRMAAAIKTNDFSIDQLVEALTKASFRKNAELAEKVKDLQKYGIKHKVYSIRCKECGGSFDYHLPLLAGISL